MSASPELLFDLVQPDEVPDALSIEIEGFPPDEAADLEKLKYRQEVASDLFLGAFIARSGNKRKIIGYICSTLSPSKTLTHDSMSTHVPGTSTVCIHSICIQKAWRKKGIATRLLNEYVSRLRLRAEAGSVPYERVALISHQELIPFYETAGFINIGKSDVVHGALPWYELRVELRRNLNTWGGSTINALDFPTIPTVTDEKKAISASTHIEQQEQIPAGVWEALLRSSSSKNTGRLLSSFDSVTSVVTEATPGTMVNKFDLLCPRDGCGSVILKEGVGRWVERGSEQIDPSEIPLNPLLTPLPPPGQTAQWWLITPSPMAFENIGFSKPVGGQVLSTAVFSGVRRQPSWYGFLAPLFFYDIVLMIGMGNQTESSPPTEGLCTFQAVFLYSIPGWAVVAFGCFIVCFYLEVKNLIGSEDDDKEAHVLSRRARLLSIFIPLLSFIGFLVLNGLTVLYSNQKPLASPNTYKLYCTPKSHTGLYVGGAIMGVTMLMWIVIIVRLGILFRTHFSKLKGKGEVIYGQTLSVYIRITVISVAGSLVIGLYVWAFAARDSDSVIGSYLLGLPSIILFLVFATQRDIMKSWAFWRRSNYNHKHQAPTISYSTQTETLTSQGEGRKSGYLNHIGYNWTVGIKSFASSSTLAQP
ncbi:hypothetical protein NP233_g702 [Leucocoprinus birnbaumii]|uniref:N-acetyltransferase domain-containing protein n=1 Tax=Leucocoprinus birnbaumii TaxID=56174 RepID=A0AAD5YVI8_9AGAR|nr:hypothetical protein NP233_g702 [Leucocoprinus birnbaumii]